MGEIRAHVFVRGSVQGVFFRANMRDKASELGVRGWVKNSSDGSVEAVLEGEQNSISEVLRWCHVGPSGAIVEEVRVLYEVYSEEFTDFKIIH